MENPIIDQELKPNVSPMPTALRYGLIAGVVSIIVSLLLYLLDMYREQTLTTVISIAVLVTFVYLAQKSHRDNDLGGYMKFGRAVGVGMLTVLFMAIVGAVYNFIFFEFIDSSILEETLRETENNMMDRGMSDEDINQAMKITQIFVNPFFFAVTALFFSGIFGLIVSLITGAITKRD